VNILSTNITIIQYDILTAVHCLLL